MIKPSTRIYVQALLALLAAAAVSAWSVLAHYWMTYVRTGIFAPGQLLQRTSIIYAVPLAFLLLLALLETFVFKEAFVPSLGLKPNRFKDAMRSNVVILLALLVGAVISSVVRLRAKPWDFVYHPLMTLPELAIVVVCEEITFRGYVQPRLQKLFGGWGGVALTAFLFATVHLPAQVFVQHASLLSVLPGLAFMFVGGLFFGWLAKKDGCIYGSMTAHWLLNMCGAY